jgi:hypothetical protein
MDVVRTKRGVGIVSFTTGLVPVPATSLVQLLRRNPEGVIYNLVNRADRAKQAGKDTEAAELYAQAEKFFGLVTTK